MNNTLLPDDVGTQPTQEQEPVKFDQDEASAIFINQSHKQFRKLVYEMANRKKRSVSRVLEAVLFEPLEEVQLHGKEEEQLLDLCLKIMYHKSVIFDYAQKQIEKKKETGELNEQEK